MTLIGQEISRDILKNIMEPLGHRMKIWPAVAPVGHVEDLKIICKCIWKRKKRKRNQNRKDKEEQKKNRKTLEISNIITFHFYFICFNYFIFYLFLSFVFYFLLRIVFSFLFTYLFTFYFYFILFFYYCNYRPPYMCDKYRKWSNKPPVSNSPSSRLSPQG